MLAVGGGERSPTTSERLVVLECLPTTLQVLFGLILDDGPLGSNALVCITGYSSKWIHFSTKTLVRFLSALGTGSGRFSLIEANRERYGRVGVSPLFTGKYLRKLEARVGVEPTHKGFADLSLTTWVPRPAI